VGDYKLKYVVHDHAGMYGNSGNDNPAELDAVITVRDTVKPTITINGDSDMTHECATPYFVLAEAHGPSGSSGDNGSDGSGSDGNGNVRGLIASDDDVEDADDTSDEDYVGGV
jgi:hypothetical protein